MSHELPEGFVPLPRSSEYLDRVGPLFYKVESEGVAVALRVSSHHTNNKGTAHGGALLALADITLGRNLRGWQATTRSPWTVSLTAEFTGAAKVGDWVEGRADFCKHGRTLAFVNGYLSVEGKRILRASAVFRAA